MRWRLFAVLASFAALPEAAFADMGIPGQTRIPHDFVFEVEADFPGYQFWLVSPRGTEPLDLAPGRPFRVDGEGRHGSHRVAWVVVTPVGLAEEMGKAEFEKLASMHKLPSEVFTSESIDFLGSVPFYDTRERVIDRYRLEFVPGQHVRLVWLEQNKGSAWPQFACFGTGVLVPIATVWGGWWAIRRVRRKLASKHT